MSGEAQRGTLAEHVGLAAREFRARRELTLRDVADEADISVSYLSEIERGQTGSLGLDLAQRVASALGVGLADLLEKVPTGKWEPCIHCGGKGLRWQPTQPNSTPPVGLEGEEG